MSESVFERAERAGAFKELRGQALQDDPDVLAIRRTAAAVEASTRLSLLAAQFDDDTETLAFDPDDKDARAVERMSNAAAQDDGYRVQLVDLAALHGGLYLDALYALYVIEVKSLGRFEAEARHQLDKRQLDETRARDREAQG